MSQSPAGHDLTRLTDAQVERLAEGLSPAERHVILHHGTERSGCGVFLDNKRAGVYTCRLCGLPLFRSTAKFESGTGWPSFFAPFDRAHVASSRTTATACAAPSSAASAATATSATSSPTAPNQPACATASMAYR